MISPRFVLLDSGEKNQKVECLQLDNVKMALVTLQKDLLLFSCTSSTSLSLDLEC
jgi:hypothetical protein